MSSCIPVVWQRDGNTPPEWVIFEMQGELQYKGAAGGRLEKKGAATTSSNVTTFEGLQMGILSPHSEHGPDKPELRIGNLVIPGKLVKLPKPFLVLRSDKVNVSCSSTITAAPASSSSSSSPAPADKKRRRDGEEQKEQEKRSSGENGSNFSTSAVASSFPSSCLQTIAIIRHKYVFSQRPFSICETATASAH